MLHLELVPPWLILVALLGTAIAFALLVQSSRRRAAKARKRLYRRRKNLARGRMWAWIMGRSRQRRLTFRKADEEAA